MITAVYWSVLYNPERSKLDFENFSGHLVITLIHIVDVLLSDRWARVFSMRVFYLRK